MKRYSVFWKNGHQEILNGNDITDALIKAGYTLEDLHLLSFYLPGVHTGFFWSECHKKWIYSFKRKPVKIQ